MVSWMRWFFCSSMLLSTTHCTYHMVQNRVVMGNHTLALWPFEESEPIGLCADLTAQLHSVLASSGVQLQSNAPVSLKGKIHNPFTSVAPGSGGSQVTFYQHNVQIEAWLETAQGDVLWKTSINASELFLPHQNQQDLALGTETNKQWALHRVAQKAAQIIYERLSQESPTP
jgi:hypothetical protein